jgi:hypothetical protein
MDSNPTKPHHAKRVKQNKDIDENSSQNSDNKDMEFGNKKQFGTGGKEVEMNRRKTVGFSQ